MGALGDFFEAQHAAFWTLLEAKASFTTAVASGNRIKFTSDPFDIYKKDVAEGELPEVAVVAAGMAFGDRRASNATNIEMFWEVWATTGRQQFSTFLEVQAGIFIALINWDDTMKALTWRGETPVKDCDLQNTKDSLLYQLEGAEARGHTGWRSVWRGVNRCWFSHGVLQTGT